MSPPTNQHPAFLQAGCPCCRPTNSVGALNGNLQFFLMLLPLMLLFVLCSQCGPQITVVVACCPICSCSTSAEVCVGHGWRRQGHLAKTASVLQEKDCTVLVGTVMHCSVAVKTTIQTTSSWLHYGKCIKLGRCITFDPASTSVSKCFSRAGDVTV